MAAPPPVVLQALGVHLSPLIFMHGLRDEGASWAPAFRRLQRELPHLKVVCPNAPRAPVTLNMGMRMPSWHDITTLDGEMRESDLRGLDESVATVRDLIRREVQDEGVAPERIVLGGFSQGAAMAVATGLTHPQKLAGVVCLSGYIAREKFEEKVHESNAGTEVLVCHGTADQVVQFARGQNVHDTLAKAGVPVTLKSYAGMGHSASDPEIRDVEEFIKGVLASVPNAKQGL